MKKDLLVIQEHKNGVKGYQAFLELSLQQIGEPNPVWLTPVYHCLLKWSHYGESSTE